MLSSVYLLPRFYQAMAAVIFLYLLSYSFPMLFIVASGLLVLLLMLTIYDAVSLRSRADHVMGSRTVIEKLSLGDEQEILYELENQSGHAIHYQLVDELPMQFQHREQIAQGLLNTEETQQAIHKIRPLERGVFRFGKLLLYSSSKSPGLIQFRSTIAEPVAVAVYPSILQMRKYELQVFSQTATLSGVRQIRSIGENDEFESLKPYMQGDNFRSINWKATARKNELVVNQFQNTRSQTVYCIVDKGRSMKMPFDGLTLLDYAINSTLVLSNIILRKYDKAGLITFSDRIGTVLQAESKQGQLEKIAEHLYQQRTDYLDANYELLFYHMRRLIRRRSILLFFTNFEQPVDLERNLPYLISLSKRHLLIVVLFVNTALEASSEMECEKKSDIYLKVFSQVAMVEKREIAQKLLRNGIQTILTTPKNLSINVINKYLEVKSKRMK